MRFPDDVTILRASAADEYGNPAANWDAPTELPAKAFVMLSSRTSLGHAKLTGKALFPVGTDVREGDRLLWGSKLFGVEAPITVRSPSRSVLVSAALAPVEVAP